MSDKNVLIVYVFCSLLTERKLMELGSVSHVNLLEKLMFEEITI